MIRGFIRIVIKYANGFSMVTGVCTDMMSEPMPIARAVEYVMICIRRYVSYISPTSRYHTGHCMHESYRIVSVLKEAFAPRTDLRPSILFVQMQSVHAPIFYMFRPFPWSKYSWRLPHLVSKHCAISHIPSKRPASLASGHRLAHQPRSRNPATNRTTYFRWSHVHIFQKHLNSLHLHSNSRPNSFNPKETDTYLDTPEHQRPNRLG